MSLTGHVLAHSKRKAIGEEELEESGGETNPPSTIALLQSFCFVVIKVRNDAASTQVDQFAGN
jgi:hypothetical protein